MNRARSLLLLTVLVFLMTAAGRAVGQEKYDPTVILISIDGMGYDYLDIYAPPELKRLATNGVRARWLIPAYPTKTFPNHYTVATGLYPGNHGLIENNMFDAATGKWFGLGDRNAVEDPMWWGGEPIWITAQKQGLIAGAYFFPGTETPIAGVRPKFWKTYDGKVPNDERVETVLSWFDLPRNERPRIITMYFSDVDDAGHAHGPEATETRDALLKVDGSISRLVAGLGSRGALDSANIIVFSDHGMAPYKIRDAVVLDKYFDANDVERVFWVGEFTQIFPKPGTENKVYESIRSQLPATAKIYRRNEFPKRFRLDRSKRVAPLVVVPEPGTVITNQERYARAERDGILDRTRGGHGYDNLHPLMRATFIASGPVFKQGYVSDPFESVDIYNLMTRVLGLKPAKNDGKWRRIKQVLR
ncbi:MAG TPA: ectonucleotide pyrophosphatase/phosphodiesterase [Pyrinomonadaceae bacterium]